MNRKITKITHPHNPKLPTNPAHYQLSTYLCTGMSPRYVKNWTTVEAVREILQNYLDVKSDFGVGGEIERYRKPNNSPFSSIRIEDFGPGLKPQHLALGISEKSDQAIGRFGKGLKQAFLVLARELRMPLIETNSQFIEPVIEWSNDYNTEILMLHIYDNLRPADQRPLGTKFWFLGTQEEIDTGKSFFLEFIKEDNLKYNQISKYVSTPGGMVFVSGSRVGAIEDSIFSYHIPHDVAESYSILSSDRDMINTEALKKCLRDLTYSGNLLNSDIMTDLIKSIKDKTKIGDRFEHSVYMYAPNTQAIQNQFRTIIETIYNSTEILLADDHVSDREAKYRGMKIIDIPWNWSQLFSGLGFQTTSRWIQDNQPKVEPDVIPWESLLKSGYANMLECVEKMNELITTMSADSLLNSFRYGIWDEELNGSNVKVVRNLSEFMGQIGGGRKYSGCYIPESKTILLSVDIVYDYRQLFDTLYHEFTHKFSGADDMSVLFESALCELAVYLAFPAKPNTKS